MAPSTLDLRTRRWARASREQRLTRDQAATTSSQPGGCCCAPRRYETLAITIQGRFGNAELIAPQGVGPFPATIIRSTHGYQDHTIRTYADERASNGNIVVLMPAIPLEDGAPELTALVAHLHSLPGVDRSNILIVDH